MESLVVINSSLFDTQVYNVPSNGPAGGCELASKIGRNLLLGRPGGVAVARATSFSEQYSDRQLKIMGRLSES